ncbi:nicotinate-nucleotide adenylyltransferase [bioreactor metagenome]|uniref:bis(5'-nucleosyl)-tetraphosphatase (symmetrical) n=1 Tax=bioreactor metagenome TaxID=1076179 RepID=A0A644XIS7_9ZZZZ
MKPEKKERIGIYGGTFDPPHLGHMEAASAAMDTLGLSKLFFIPARLPPHKMLSQDSAPPEQRLAMTALMAGGMGPPDRVRTLDLELNRPGLSYTSDTLEYLSAEYPKSELWLLMGSDMFGSLQTWHDPHKVMRLASIAAFARSETENGELFAIQGAFLNNKFGAEICTIQLPKITDISSTSLRSSLREGKGKQYLWPAVYGYILRNGLYGVKSDLTRLSDEDLRAVSYSMVKAKRIAHIRGTEETAAAMAKKWGADEEKARRAAILHDCTKYLTLEQQLALCGRYHIVPDELERQTLKLLHAKTGAALARDMFGECPDVVNAIRWHTTGKPGMTTLEKIIYLADYIEPTRDFPGVDTLRAVAEESLDKGVKSGLAMTVEEMRALGTPVHHNTLDALEGL